MDFFHGLCSVIDELRRTGGQVKTMLYFGSAGRRKAGLSSKIRWMDLLAEVLISMALKGFGNVVFSIFEIASVTYKDGCLQLRLDDINGKCTWLSRYVFLAGAEMVVLVLDLESQEQNSLSSEKGRISERFTEWKRLAF